MSDRVVQAALLHVLEPIFERDFADRVMGFDRTGLQGCVAPGGGTAEGRIHVDSGRGPEELLRHDSSGPLMERVEEKVSDGRVLDLVKQFLEPAGDGRRRAGHRKREPLKER